MAGKYAQCFEGSTEIELDSNGVLVVDISDCETAKRVVPLLLSQIAAAPEREKHMEMLKEACERIGFDLAACERGVSPIPGRTKH